MSANTKITRRFERSSRTLDSDCRRRKVLRQTCRTTPLQAQSAPGERRNPETRPSREWRDRHIRQDRELPSISLTVDTSHTISQGSPEGEYTQRFSSTATAIMDRGILLGARWQLGS